MRTCLIIVLLLSLGAAAHGKYDHPFQNFDDDVDAQRETVNLFGGTSDTLYDTSKLDGPEFELSRDTLNTRTSLGRCLRIDYGPLTEWSMYAESFAGPRGDLSRWFDLSDLFPDFTGPDFVGRKIDSIAFWWKLDAAEPLRLELKLENAAASGAILLRDLESDQGWQRISMPLADSFPGVDLSRAKFFGLTFSAGLGNAGESGTLYVDDIVMIENAFTKPTLDSGTAFLAYLNQVHFRHFWTAVAAGSRFALDNHVWSDLISVDAIGFQLAAYAIAGDGCSPIHSNSARLTFWTTCYIIVPMPRIRLSQRRIRTHSPLSPATGRISSMRRLSAPSRTGITRCSLTLCCWPEW